MTEPQLEAVIQTLVDTSRQSPVGSAAYRMALRQLRGLRDHNELAGLIIAEHIMAAHLSLS